MHKEMAAWNWSGSMQLLSFHSCLFEYILAHGISGNQPVPAVFVGFELAAVQQLIERIFADSQGFCGLTWRENTAVKKLSIFSANTEMTVTTARGIQ